MILWASFFLFTFMTEVSTTNKIIHDFQDTNYTFVLGKQMSQSSNLDIRHSQDWQ